MNVLLLYPTRLDSEGRPTKYKQGFTPPLALAVLNRLTPERHRVTIVNEIVEEIDFTASYDLVGISAMTSQIPRAYQIADRFRAVGAKVVIGGIHGTLFPKEVKGHADAVAIGEAEPFWENILNDCENNQLQDFYRNPSLPDLKRLIIPKWDNMNLAIYPRVPGKKLPMMPIYTSRGCPNSCRFCCVTKAYGGAYRKKPVANVIAEIMSVDADFFYFVDDNIASDAEYSRDLFTEICRLDKKIYWFSAASTRILEHPDVIDLAAKSGCTGLFIGIETINKDTLRDMRKGFNNVDEYGTLFGRLVAAGIVPYISIVLGFDHDTPASINETLNYLLTIKGALAAFFVLTPLPGTELFNQMKKQGRLLHEDWSKYDASNIVFKPKQMTADELYRSYWKIYQEFFSLLNIGKRVVYHSAKARRPVFGFIASLFFQLMFRKATLACEHSFCGGIGRLPSKPSSIQSSREGRS